MSNRKHSATNELAAGLKASIAVFVVGFIAFAADRAALHPVIDTLVESSKSTPEASIAPYYLPAEFGAPSAEVEAHIEAF